MSPVALSLSLCVLEGMVKIITRGGAGWRGPAKCCDGDGCLAFEGIFLYEVRCWVKMVNSLELLLSVGFSRLGPRRGGGGGGVGIFSSIYI